MADYLIEQRRRANALLLHVFEDQQEFSAADVAHVAAALDEAEARGRAAPRAALLMAYRLLDPFQLAPEDEKQILAALADA